MAVFVILFFFMPFEVSAQTLPSVFINEIAWMGTPIENVDSRQEWRYEWLELQNTKENSVTLNGWSVELYRQDELYFTIPLFGNIPANGYFLIGASDKISHVDINYANLSGKLVNSGMKVILKNNEGDIVDEVDAKEGWQAGDNASKRTMERKTGLGPVLWHTSVNVGGTPKGQNSEGLKELASSLSSFATKKDLNRSFKDSLNIFNGTTLVAFLLSLGSSLLILLLRRLLLSRA